VAPINRILWMRDGLTKGLGVQVVVSMTVPFHKLANPGIPKPKDRRRVRWGLCSRTCVWRLFETAMAVEATTP
jgi:hypothetical protein